MKTANCFLRAILAPLVGVSIVFAFITRPTAHESPVDHVERSLRLSIAGDKIVISYRLQITERAALLQLHRMDTDKNGTISGKERDTFFNSFSAQLAAQLKLEIDRRAIEVKPAAPVKLDAEFGQTYVFSAPLNVMGPGMHAGNLLDEYSRAYPGAYRVRAEERKIGVAQIQLRMNKDNPAAQEHPGMMTIDFDVIQP